MTSIRLTAYVLLLITCGVGGCASREYRPSPEQVEAFLKRRAFVVSTIRDSIKEPMPGTSYPEHSPMSAGRIADRIEVELGYPDRAGVIRQDIQQFGHCFLEPGLGLEFDVELSDQLTKDTDGGVLARQLHYYYARTLKQAGWYIAGSGSVPLSPNTVTYTSLWTDRGEGSNTSIQKPGYSSLSIESTIHEPYDTRRGYFRVLIGVRVDTDVKRAHVTINYWGAIGR
jgi:hypothetical protein